MIHTLQISHTSYHEFKMDNSDNITIYNDNFFTIVIHHFYLDFEEKKNKRKVFSFEIMISCPNYLSLFN